MSVLLGNPGVQFRHSCLGSLELFTPIYPNLLLVVLPDLASNISIHNLELPNLEEHLQLIAGRLCGIADDYSQQVTV